MIAVECQILTKDEAKDRGLKWWSGDYEYYHDYYLVLDEKIAVGFNSCGNYYEAFKHLIEKRTKDEIVRIEKQIKAIKKVRRAIEELALTPWEDDE